MKMKEELSPETTADAKEASSPVETIVIGQKKRQAQAVFCKCKSLVAACMAPHCFEDKEWQKDIRQFSKDGYEIRMVDPEEVRLTLSSCKCEEEQVSLAL